MKNINRLLTDILLVRPEKVFDQAGMRVTWTNRDLMALGIAEPFVQDNQSRSTRNVLRGLHYQIKHPQGKLIQVLAGAVFDVVVDLRRSSPTFGKHACFVLSDKNCLMAWIPPGYAHGFYVTSEQADVLYSVTDYRFAEHERTLLWNDPQLAIPWPLGEEPPILSDKDRSGIPFANTDCYF